MRLSADDRLDIVELPAKYADALDHLQPERLRDVFTIDAIWESPSHEWRITGLDEIMAFMGRDDIHPGAHLITNIYIDGVVADTDAADSDGVMVTLRSRSVFPVGESNPAEPTAVFYGRYEDDVIKTGDGWRIRHRRFEFGS